MPRKKYQYDINAVELTHVHSGDQDNNIYYSFFSSNDEQKKAALDKLLTTKDILGIIVECIFTKDINDDQLRRLTTALTFLDAICQITGNTLDGNITGNDLFFALLVNWNCSHGKGTNRIRSYSALKFAKQSVDSAGRELDYKEYIVQGGEEGKFKGDYVAIVISPKEFGNKFEINLPIISMKLGLFRFATEQIAGYAYVLGDSEKTSLTIPAYLWLDMISEAMGRRITTKFSKLETKHLSKLVSTDARYIDEFLAINDFSSKFSFINAYEYECDENDGSLTLKNTEEPPEITKGHFEWVETRGHAWFLKSPKFYIVSQHGSGIHILAQD